MALFHKCPARVGLFGKPIVDSLLDRHFGRAGVAAIVMGMTLAAGSLGLGTNGWELSRLWFYLVGGALMVFVGLQLVISWVLMRMLE